MDMITICMWVLLEVVGCFLLYNLSFLLVRRFCHGMPWLCLLLLVCCYGIGMVDGILKDAPSSGFARDSWIRAGLGKGREGVYGRVCERIWQLI
jgi:hypothetical protein